MATTTPRPTGSATTSARPTEAPFTLAEAPARSLGVREQAALWGSLGVTLTIPAAAVFVLDPAEGMPLSLAAALTAVVVGSVLGSLLLAAAAVPGAVTGAPAMVLMRGIFGRRGSWLPTGINLAQCLGWACVEVLIIAEVASRLTSESLRPVWVLVAGVLATAMALRPLGAVHVLRRYAVWAVLAATAYLFWGVLRDGLPERTGTWHGFWLALDVVIALPVSWAPLVADYSRHARTPRTAFVGTLTGYAVACATYFTLGVFAVLALSGLDTSGPYGFVGSLLAVPVGWLALLILVLDELDEAFANIYSTAVSTQNLLPRADRRRVAVAVGAVAVAVALLVDVTGYESFLLLIGSVFVPLFGVLLADWYLVSRGRWQLGLDAPVRWGLVAAWALGFVAYQLVNPGLVGWWADGWTSVRDALHLVPPTWLGASLASFAVAALATVVPPAIARGVRPGRSRPAR